MTERNGDKGATGDLCREDQFAQVVQRTLTESGELQRVKASMRAMILNVIRAGDRSAIVKVKERNRNPAADLVNQMIMDYFHWYGFQYAIEMFATESGSIGTGCPNRQQLIEAFGGSELYQTGGGGGGGSGVGCAGGVISNGGVSNGSVDLPILLQIAMKLLCDRRGEQR